MRNLARSLVFDDNVADDVVQETWLAVLRDPPEALGSARAWLSRIVRNFAYRSTRERGRRERREIFAARDEAVPSAFETCGRDAARRSVTEAAERLGEPFRETILLRFRDGLPPREIARRHGVPVETVRSRVRIARERLRHELDAEFGDRRTWSLALLPLASMPIAPASPTTAGAATGSSGIGGPGGALHRASREATRIVRSAGAAATSTSRPIAIAAIVGALGLVALFSWPRDRNESAPQSNTASLTPARDMTNDIGPTRRDLARARVSRDVAAALPVADEIGRSTQPATPRGTLVVRTVLDEDGSPAAGVRIDIARSSLVDPFERLVAARSDASGIARVELPIGEYGVQCFHEAWSALAVDVTEHPSSEIELRVGSTPRTVHGIVVDADGRPVSEASVWTHASSLEGRSARAEITTSSDGRFELTGMIDTMLVGARSETHAPSRLRQVGTTRGASPDRPMRLRLGATGGRIDLDVRTVAGHPVADASVDLGHSPLNHVAAPVEPRAAFRLRTDADGRVVSPALEPGFYPVTIRSPEHAPSLETIEVRADETTTFSVTLTEGSSVSGRVVDSRGRPVAGATVEIVEPALTAFHTTTTANDGSYRIDGLAGGDTFFTSQAIVDDRYESIIESRFVPRDDALEWSPQLESPRPIAGQVVDAHGTPLARCRVTITNETYAHDNESTTTDAEGYFRFADPTASSYRLVVQAPRSDSTPNRHANARSFRVVSNVRPGTTSLRVEMPAAIDPDEGASIVGTATFASRALFGTPVDVVLRQATVGAVATTSLAPDGSFRIDGVASADYELAFVLVTRDASPYTAATVAVTIPSIPGFVHDTGTIELVEPASVTLRFPGMTDDDASTLRITLAHRDTNATQLLDIQGFDGGDFTARADLLLAGPYRVRVESERYVTDERDLVLGPGRTLDLPVELERGHRAMIRIRAADDTASLPATELVVRDRHGRTLSKTTPDPGPFGREALVRLVLPASRVTIEATGADGSHALRELDLGPADSAHVTTAELTLSRPR